MMKDEWVRVAMTDDVVVAEFLLRLKQLQAKPPSAVIPLRWGLRLPRSRPATASATGTGGGGGGGGFGGEFSMRCDAVSFRKGSDSSTRCSPTTPLSWSGGSGTADEETSHHDGNCSPSGVRSKGTATAETASTSTKRSRKKKTFSELKEEEGHLIKEKLHLKKEIATLHVSCEEHRARNQNLKRIKRDLNVQSANNSDNLGLYSTGLGKATLSLTHYGGVSSFNGVPSTPPIHAKCGTHPQSDSCETDNASSSQDRFFLLPDLNILPDLNMMPSEEDTGTRNLYEMR